VRLLADAAGSLPLIAYRRRADGSRERFDGRLADILDRPFPAATQANLVSTIVCTLNTHGNCFLGKLRPGGDRSRPVDRLWPLSPDRVVVEMRAGRLRYVYTDHQGRQTDHGPDEVLHIKAMATSADGLLGLSPLQCRAALGLNSAIVDYSERFFQADARPSGILHAPEGQGAALDDLVAKWESRHMGTGNAHRLAAISGDISFTPVSLPADTMQLIEQRKLSSLEVCRIFRVTPHLVGVDSGESMTYTNVEQAALEFVKFSLQPWLTVIEQAVSGDPDLSPRNIFVEFLVDNLLRADAKTRAEVYTAALDPETGWMTREEVRRLENLEPEPDPPPARPREPVRLVSEPPGSEPPAEQPTG
jgi:HK97 family phage portal protein